MAKKRILIIDDEQDFLRLAAMHLKRTSNYEIRTESKTSRAVAVASEFNPDLILLDIIMPEMDGGEVANQIRSLSGLKDVRIVFLTALIRKEETPSREEYIDKQDFVTKLRYKEQLVDYIEGIFLRNKR
ncbi:PleD family two-component system response regulator [Candidatus Omnitrophota bacterium]